MEHPVEWTRREGIVRAVYAAVDEINEQLPLARRLEKSAGTVLLGPGGRLDSLGVVSLIAATQQRLEETLGVRLTLADGEMLATAQRALSTLGGFIDYIEAIMDGRGHA